MNDVTVDKDELKAKLVENRAAHRAIFDEAVEGYRKKAVRMLEDHIANIKAGTLTKVYVVIPEPSDHTADYDRAIAMLEMSVDAQVEIDEDDFASYVLDDWAWKREFLTTNSAYSMTAASLIG